MSTPTRDSASRQLVNRRILLARSAAAAAFSVMTPNGLVSAREARATHAPLSLLSNAEASALGALGEALLPDAEEAGIVNWVDSQLGSDIPRLIYIYFDFPQPPAAFYQASLATLDSVSKSRYDTVFAEATAEQRSELTGELLPGMGDEWDGPPSSIFYLSVRADALDVVYGTMDGFADLDIPYMAHIKPPKPAF